MQAEQYREKLLKELAETEGARPLGTPPGTQGGPASARRGRQGRAGREARPAPEDGALGGPVSRARPARRIVRRPAVTLRPALARGPRGRAALRRPRRARRGPGSLRGREELRLARALIAWPRRSVPRRVADREPRGEQA